MLLSLPALAPQQVVGSPSSSSSRTHTHTGLDLTLLDLQPVSRDIRLIVNDGLNVLNQQPVAAQCFSAAFGR